MFWQEIVRRAPVIFGSNLEHIINSAEVKRISVYLYRHISVVMIVPLILARITLQW
jgi:hypothetical protein